MILTKKTYKTLDALSLAVKTSPVCTALLILLSVTQAVIPTAATALTVANFVDTAAAILRDERPRGDIYVPLILLLLVLGVFTAIGAVIQLVNVRVTLNLQRELKPAMIEKHAALDFKHIENAESWELISRVTRNPVSSVMDGFGAFIQLIQIIVNIVSVLALIAAQVWWAAPAIIAFSVPMLRLNMRAGKKNYQAGRDVEKFNRRTEYLDEILTGRDASDERTMFGYGEAINERWREQYETGRKLKLKVSAKTYIVSRSYNIILGLIALLVALALIDPVVSGGMSAGMFMGIVGAVFGMVYRMYDQVSRTMESITTIGEYMKDLTAFVGLSEADGALSEPDAEAIAFTSLEFRGVRFRYPSGDRFILDGLSFTLQAGRHYAFVGRNGAGKTTITKLLTGLYADYEGEILINGKELRQYPQSAVKALFSVVYQDFARYYIPLKANIALGDVAGTDVDRMVPGTVRLAGLEETVAELKNGENTPLGKILTGGQDISGGQWQRLAIARSLISRAPIKILDEPTAALDPISESRVYSEFENLMRGKTTIFISHRLGSTKLADEILVIDGGLIIERGTHDELLETNGQYAEMFEAQRGWYQ